MDDYNALYAVLADSDIMQHYPYTFDEVRVRGWILKNIERYRIFGFGLWAVCIKESGEMIGDCGLTMQNIEFKDEDNGITKVFMITKDEWKELKQKKVLDELNEQ